MLGFGTDSLTDIPTDEYARIDIEALESVLKEDTEIPTLLLLQAGDVNTGGFDDFSRIMPIARAHHCWVHVDGAFGLWAAGSPDYRHLVAGAELADSWATDGHKWLNVPYDCGYAFVADPEAHARAFSQQASYLVHLEQVRDQVTYNPEFSRRGRGFATWAAIRELGQSGIEQLIQRTCQHAKAIVEGIGDLHGAEIVVHPIINQGLVRFTDPAGTGSRESNVDRTEKVINAINATGEAFFQATTFKGKRCMRISVSGWRTNDDDVKRTIDAVRKAILIVDH
jgi:aromatic-L-amino-acid decarboxylase